MTALNFAQAKHLVSRTGYGPEFEKIHQFSRQTKHQAIDSLLTAPGNFMLPLPSVHGLQELHKMRKTSDQQKQVANKLFRADIKNIKAWAAGQALQNPNALQEKMTWFWHNHFTSSSQKSRRSAALLLDQTQLIRQHALGNFAELLRVMPYDPLMLIYLDGINNSKGQPNENFSRELLELFTLGEGHYTEQDIKEVARAFTGWRIRGKTGEVVRIKKHYDTGSKTVFGQKGNFDSDDIIELLLRHPRTAELIAEKMWHTFVSITPPEPAIITHWATVFRNARYDISTLLREVFSSPAFWHQQYRATLIKSPLDLIIGTLRVLDLEDNNLPLPDLSNQLRRMGQDLYTPPNVKGWPGGVTWVDDYTLPIRQQFLRRLTRGKNNQHAAQANNNMMMQNMSGKNKGMQMNTLPTLPPEQWEHWLLPTPAVSNTKFENPDYHLQAILLDPAYQLI